MSIQLTDVRATFAKAIEKAISVKPRVSVASYGVYTVESSTPGQTYTVEFFKQDGTPHAECSCRAGQNGNACYHIPAAFVMWKIHASIRRQRNAGTMTNERAVPAAEIERGDWRQPRAETFAAAAVATFSTEEATGVCACGMSAERCELRRDPNQPVTTTNPTLPNDNQSTEPAPILDPLPTIRPQFVHFSYRDEPEQRSRFTHVELESVSYPSTARVADYASPEYQAKLRRDEADLFG